MSELFCTYYPSPIGNLNLYASSDGIRKIEFSQDTLAMNSNAVLEEAVRQLDEYFSGKRMEFDLPLDAKGTSFQKQVWEHLLRIPYGATRSYQELAGAIGKKQAARAVGQANNRNPLPILVPCHRVIGKDQSLVGYAGGLALKKWLLEHESKKNILKA